MKGLFSKWKKQKEGVVWEKVLNLLVSQLTYSSLIILDAIKS
jgi:hypothetical protein